MAALSRRSRAISVTRAGGDAPGSTNLIDPERGTEQLVVERRVLGLLVVAAGRVVARPTERVDVEAARLGRRLVGRLVRRAGVGGEVRGWRPASPRPTCADRRTPGSGGRRPGGGRGRRGRTRRGRGTGARPPTTTASSTPNRHRQRPHRPGTTRSPGRLVVVGRRSPRPSARSVAGSVTRPARVGGHGLRSRGGRAGGSPRPTGWSCPRRPPPRARGGWRPPSGSARRRCSSAPRSSDHSQATACSARRRSSAPLDASRAVVGGGDGRPTPRRCRCRWWTRRAGPAGSTSAWRGRRRWRARRMSAQAWAAAVARSPSALVTTTRSASSMIPRLMPCRSSPPAGEASSTNRSVRSATATSLWPTPTVSTSTTSKPAASHSRSASRVRRATPPSSPPDGEGRMKAVRVAGEAPPCGSCRRGSSRRCGGWWGRRPGPRPGGRRRSGGCRRPR